jgi:hypothetical protein
VRIGEQPVEDPGENRGARPQPRLRAAGQPSAGAAGAWGKPVGRVAPGTVGAMAGIIVLLLILGAVIVMTIVATSGGKDHAGH